MMLKLIGYLYPAAFRREFGAEWVRFVREQRRERRYRGRLLGALLYWTDVTRDALVSGLAMRWSDGAFRGAKGGVDDRELGGMTDHEGHHPELNGRARGNIADSVLLDLLFALRTFRKSPGFAIVAVLTLALGIGGSAAIFTVVNSVILEPLPYPEPDRLVWLSSVRPGAPDSGGTISEGMYHQFQTLPHIFDEVAMYWYRAWEHSLTGDGEPERVLWQEVTGNFFEVLGVQPVAGRWIQPSDLEGDTGLEPIVLSHGLWAQRYGSDPSLVGQTIHVHDQPHEVIGVMPRDFGFPSQEIDLWVGMRLRRPWAMNTVRHSVARLQPGVSVSEADTQVNALVQGLVEAVSEGAGSREMATRSVANGLQFHAEPLKDEIVRTVRQGLWVVFGAVIFVLLMACANVANLFLVRAEARRREIAVRTAVGAGRGRLARHFLAEGTGLAAVGGLLGLGLASAAVRVLVLLGPADLPRLHEVSVDTTVVAFTAVVALFGGVLFGVLALVHSSSRVLFALKEGTQNSGFGRSRFEVRNVLVVSQVAFALMLLVGSGLMIRSFWHLTRVNLGLDPTNVLTFELRVGSDYETREEIITFHEELYDRLGGLPGVQAASGTTCLPLKGHCIGGDLLTEKDSARVLVDMWPVRVGTGYFETMQIPLISGRVFQQLPDDNYSIVLSKSLAEARWPGGDPIGRIVHYPPIPEGRPPPPRWYTVVGVVADVPSSDLREDPEMRRAIYFSEGRPRGDGRTMTVVMRTSTPPLDLIDEVRSTVWSLDADLPLGNIRTMEEYVRTARSQMAFTMVLLVIGGVTALLLGVIGIYGVISYVVGRRTAEIGIRMALGAKAADVKAMVLRQGGGVVVVGVLIGLVGAFSLTRVMEAVVFGVSPTDPATYIASSIGLLVIALLATYLPARRAAEVNPVEALRAD